MFQAPQVGHWPCHLASWAPQSEQTWTVVRGIAWRLRVGRDGKPNTILVCIWNFWLAYDHPFVDGNGRTARVRGKSGRQHIYRAVTDLPAALRPGCS
ncbi:MAG: Fic family protein [Solirubrobacteraceae bacterium]